MSQDPKWRISPLWGLFFPRRGEIGCSCPWRPLCGYACKNIGVCVTAFVITSILLFLRMVTTTVLLRLRKTGLRDLAVLSALAGEKTKGYQMPPGSCLAGEGAFSRSSKAFPRRISRFFVSAWAMMKSRLLPLRSTGVKR